MNKIYQYRSDCRSCSERDLKLILNLGEIPLADALLSEPEEAKNELFAPLSLVFCPKCSLLQIPEEVDPEVLFQRNYPYYSSTNPALVEHFGQSAAQIMAEMELDKDSLVIEAASNDGVLLKNFHDAGIPTLGIDPAQGPCKKAREAGLEVINDFFSHSLAQNLKNQGRMADLFLANNVLAHVPDLNGFIKGIACLLKQEGIAVIEVPYAVDMIRKLEFDTIFHQHYSYFSLTALKAAFERFGLFIQKVHQIPIHGGSLRVFVGRNSVEDGSVDKMINAEKDLGVPNLPFYQNFNADIDHLKDSLNSLLREFRTNGKTVAGYGAAGKANTLLSHFGIGKKDLSYIGDISPHKQGKLFPGNHLKIVHPDKIYQDQPDYVLILAWNFAPQIMKQFESYRKRGGKFILPIPSVQIIE